MPIEFRCSNCQSLLHTPDGSAGKQSRCVQCGTVQVVPFPTPPPVSATQPVTNPFAADPGTINPYQSPLAFHSPTLSRDEIKAKVAWPAIGLMVTSVMGFLAIAAVMFYGVLETREQGHADEGDVIAIGMLGVMLLRYVVLFVGALLIRALKCYGFALTTAILTVLPLSCCWIPLDLPEGIMLLVVLLDPRVRAGFGTKAEDSVPRWGT